VLASLGRPARAAFLACCLLAAGAQAVGTFQYVGLSDIAINDPSDAGMSNVWKVANAPILVEARQDRAPFDLLRKALNPP
jgi:hypothetical protein